MAKKASAKQIEKTTNTPKRISLSDIKKGSLVSEIRDEKVTFFHNGEEYEADVKIKQLPFIETESLHKRLNDGENVAAEWISKSLVNENGELEFTKEQVEETFVQGLANALFNIVYGLENIKKEMAKAEKNQD